MLVVYALLIGIAVVLAILGYTENATKLNSISIICLAAVLILAVLERSKF